MSYINVSTIYRAAAKRCLLSGYAGYWRYHLGLECEHRVADYFAAPYRAADAYTRFDKVEWGEPGVLFLCLMAAIAEDRRWRIKL